MASAGVPLEEVSTLMESTGPSWMRGPDEFINDAVRRTYTGNRIIAAGNMNEMVQGGDKIQDRIFLTTAGDGLVRYDINQGFDYELTNEGVNWEVPWAFGMASMAITKHELGLNVESMGKRYRSQVYKRVLRQHHANLWTKVNNSIEDEYWARPNHAKMEASGSVSKRQPYSIPAFINEFTDGLIPAAVDVNGTAWTTVQQIAPATHPNWAPYSVGGGAGAANQAAGYTFVAGAASTTTTLFPALSRAYHKLHFHRLPKSPEYSDKTNSPDVIWCSMAGLVNYEHALVINQDTFRGVGKTTGQDPAYDGPTYRRVPIEYLESLETVLAYSDGTEAVDENGLAADGLTGAGSTDVLGPRYYFVNTNYLKFVAHESNYCTLGAPFTPSAQPFTKIQVMDLWNNNIVRSRMRLGIVGPSASTTNA